MSAYPAPHDATRRLVTLRAAGVLILAGLPGIMSLVLVLPDIPGVPWPLLLLNPALLLLVTALVGALAARRCGFRSRVVDRVVGCASTLSAVGLGTALALGVTLGFGLSLVDHLAAPLWSSPEIASTMLATWRPEALVVGVLYGGIVEEIVMRWGLISSIVWLAWKLFARGFAHPPTMTIVAGIAISALVFAAGHLPALAVQMELTPAVVARTLAFNAFLGAVFGWLFLRRDLESAMAAHVGFHIGTGATVVLLVAAS